MKKTDLKLLLLTRKLKITSSQRKAYIGYQTRRDVQKRRLSTPISFDEVCLYLAEKKINLKIRSMLWYPISDVELTCLRHS